MSGQGTSHPRKRYDGRCSRRSSISSRSRRTKKLPNVCTDSVYGRWLRTKDIIATMY